MRNAVTFAVVLGLLVAPAVRAENIVAGPNSTYLTTSPMMDQGETLTFYSFDVPNHDVTADQKGPDGKPLFSTPLIGFGESAAVVGSDSLTAGQYPFFCTIHASMRGTLTVTSAGTPKPGPGQGGGSADTTKPKVKAKVRSGDVGRVRRSGRLQVEVSVDEAAKVTLRATTKAGGRTVTIATGQVNDFTGAGKRREDLRVTRAGKSALAGRRRAPVTLTARAVDSAGNAGTARAAKTLR